MDNASYHTNVLDPAPSKYSTKKKLKSGWWRRTFVHNSNTRKTELYDLVQANAPPAKKYYIEELFKTDGHYVLRIPPYHCDLNAIEIA
ncbi:hypothetical protein JTE90_003567 [Oedothorax gibbosus]|uniref:Tc1-like transposase DDE domain-containing protein n=1 Tax=Oedothorax gibbosus TaxID=931172 RepID=A0AAV6VJ16_9ARAC|nr:hypothetical protein JTE90_003567 [Oedothorax gibbosus]